MKAEKKKTRFRPWLVGIVVFGVMLAGYTFAYFSLRETHSDSRAIYISYAALNSRGIAAYRHGEASHPWGLRKGYTQKTLIGAQIIYRNDEAWYTHVFLPLELLELAVRRMMPAD